MATEKKTVVFLGALEALITNDKNLRMAIDANVMGALVKVLKSQVFKNAANYQISLFVKFALRCLTSAIRTEPAVNRFFQIEGGISKVIEILEFVED